MVTKNQAEKMSRFVLDTRMTAAMAELDEVEATTEPTNEPEKGQHKDKLRQVRGNYHILNNEMVRRETEVAAAAIPVPKAEVEAKPTGTGENVLMNMKIKAIDRAVNSLAVFGPGCEVFTFIRNVKNQSRLATCVSTGWNVLQSGR